MADPSRRNPLDRGRDWFVDTTCIDCDVARQVAPGLIEEDAQGLSYFVRPPTTQEERLQAWRALLACPSGSIGAPRGEKPDALAYPMPITQGVFLLGYHSSDSFGAHSYLVEDPQGNVMVDAPRFVPAVERAIEARGGLKHILLTHRDDVADSDRYARRFGARVWIQRSDADAAPHATDVFEDEAAIAPGVRGFAFPGHTRGSALYLLQDRFLFTGDSLAFSRNTQDLTAFRDATWYSWTELIRSMQRLADLRFEWVFPGHGTWGHDTIEGMQRRVGRLLEWMRNKPRTAPW